MPKNAQFAIWRECQYLCPLHVSICMCECVSNDVISLVGSGAAGVLWMYPE